VTRPDHLPPAAAPSGEGERSARTSPALNGLIGVGMIVVDPEGRILLGLAHDGKWELPGGKVDPGESFEQAGARELAEETALRVRAEDVKVVGLALDSRIGLNRLSVAGLALGVRGEPRVTEPDKIVRWQWYPPQDIPDELFEPSAAVLRIWRPDPTLGEVSAYSYAISVIAAREGRLPCDDGDMPFRKRVDTA
jgi:ADP-ribose pyrophosphatase YjhB (NUDIX family)